MILYLAAHAVTGRQGLVSYMNLQEQEHALDAERDLLAAEKADLEARVRRLESAGLDLDALEEEARASFDAAHPDEIVFDLSSVER